MVKIGYARVSTDNQDPSSQIKVLMEQKIPQELIFIDLDVSGTKEPLKRPAYKKLMEFIEKGTTDTLVLTEYSRLGRNAKESLFELLRIEKMGIVVKSLSANESFINELPAELQPLATSAMMLGADLERKHISERTTWGLENAKAKGKVLGRPEVKIDWAKIDEIREKYGVSYNMARKLCGYKATTFYKEKKVKQHG
jgi:DNA invertase Pin-like site-specific DNA recombinase